METTYRNFSQRYGYEQMKATQRDEIDNDTRTDLWNVVYGKLCHHDYFLTTVGKILYTDYIKSPLDLYKDDSKHLDVDDQRIQSLTLNEVISINNTMTQRQIPCSLAIIRVVLLGYAYEVDLQEKVCCKQPANKLFDILELMIQGIDNAITDTENEIAQYGSAQFGVEDSEMQVLSNYRELYTEMINNINEVLRKNRAIYRIQESTKQFIKIGNSLELESINNATSTVYERVSKQLDEAIMDYHNGKYNNSVRKAVDAVESMIKTIAKEPNGNVKSGLNKIVKESNHKKDRRMKDSIKNMYWYASESVRHGNIDAKKDPTECEALFAIVTCSAIINYFISIDINNPDQKDTISHPTI